MSDRSGIVNYDQWMRTIEQAIAALQRGDHMAGTVSVGRLLVGNVYLDDIRVINPKTRQLALVVTDRKSGVSCTVPMPCPDTDATAANPIPYVARFSMPGTLVTTTVTAGISDVPPDSPPPGTEIVAVKLNLSTPGTTTTTVSIIVNDAVLTTISLLAGQTETLQPYSGLWTFSWRNVPPRTVTDGKVFSGNLSVLNSGSANFTAADLGSTISGGSIKFGTTISAVLDATHVQLSQAVAAAFNNATVTILSAQGYPLTDRLKAAVTAAGSGASSLGVNVYCGPVPAPAPLSV